MHNIDNGNMPAATVGRDGFSWRRVWMVACYWWPLLRWKMLAFLLISLLVGATAAMLYMIDGDFTVMQITGMATYLCIYGSAAFGKKAGRQMSIGLPARNSEKLAFMLIYNILVLPLLTIIPCSLIMLMITGECPDRMIGTAFGSLGVRYDSVFYYTAQSYSFVLMMFAALVCLWVATTARRNALAKSIGFSLLTFVTPSFLSGLLIGLGACKFMGSMAMDELWAIDQMTLIGNMLHDFTVIFAVGCAILLICWFIGLYLFIRNFNKRQC